LVEDWLSRGENASAQQRVDQLVQKFKAEGAAAPDLPRDQSDREATSSIELSSLAKAIEAVAEDLAGDEMVVARHSRKLQTLDIAGQSLRKLAVGFDRSKTRF
jgi:hypothetical protein